MTKVRAYKELIVEFSSQHYSLLSVRLKKSASAFYPLDPQKNLQLPSAFYTLFNPQIRMSADPYFTGSPIPEVRHSGDPVVRVRVRVIITIIPRNGGPPEWRTPGMADPNQYKSAKDDSERRCIKCETFCIKLSHFIHVHFRTFALSHFITSHA